MQTLAKPTLEEETPRKFSALAWLFVTLRFHLLGHDLPEFYPQHPFSFVITRNSKLL